MKSLTNLRHCFCPMFVLFVFLQSARVHAQTFDEQFDHWPLETTIKGRILIDHGATDLSGASRVLKRIVNDKKVICFQVEGAGNKVLIDALREQLGESGKLQMIRFKILPVKALKEALSRHDVVILQLGSTAGDYLEQLRPLKAGLRNLLAKKGCLILDRGAAQILGKSLWVMKQLSKGLNVLPDCVLLPWTEAFPNDWTPYLKALSQTPKAVGVALTPKTLLMLSGRKVTCYGGEGATFLLAGCGFKKPRIQTIMARENRRQRPQEFLIDLTEWRRDAIDRTLKEFPSKKSRVPHVANGSLVIVGGGGMPKGLMGRFVDLAGGVDDAKLIYVPCSEAEEISARQLSLVNSWKKMGVKHAAHIHTKDRSKANADQDFLKALKTATGIWFGGGRQWNFADSYYGTEAHRLMKAVLARGGVIGGSSAGASIQGRYLARATPIGNSEIMAPGYERGGLGFLSGVAIDQHFSQRKRQKDMTKLVNRYPQLLGIGIDESTALIVKKSKAQIVGRGRVFFYDRNTPVVAGTPDYVAVPAGKIFDLADCKVVGEAAADEKKTATKVMSFNVRYDNAGDGDNRWSNRTGLVLTTINQFAPDILGVQEALKSQVRFLKDELRGYSFHGIGRRKDGSGEFVPLFFRTSRYEKIAAGHFWHSETPEVPGSKSWDSSLPRMVSWLRLKDKSNAGQEILVANTHYDHRGVVARAKSSALIRSRLLEAYPKTPLILMGDFNATEDSQPYKTLVEAPESGKSKVRLIDSYRSVHQVRTDLEATYQKFTDSKKGRRIDWILHSEHWQTREARINNVVKAGRNSSDHYPVESVLVLK